MQKLKQKIYLGFLHVHILYHANKEPFYGVWMMEELKEHGYHIGPSHIYPLLKGLEEEGLLLIEHRIVEGHKRKYYKITSEGQQVLKDLMEKVKELSNELFDEDELGGNKHVK